MLCRLGLSQMRWLDRPSGEVIRRYEHARPGDLVQGGLPPVSRATNLAEHYS